MIFKKAATPQVRSDLICESDGGGRTEEKDAFKKVNPKKGYLGSRVI